MTEECMYIERVIYLGNFIIMFETREGEMRTIDFKPRLQKNMGDFSSLREEDNFKKFYISEQGILTWDVDLPKRNDRQINIYDVAPEFIAEYSIPVMVNRGMYNINIGQSA